MSDDERFEREVQLALRGLAAAPAPDRLVNRVAAIPSTDVGPRAWPISFFRTAATLAAAAVLVVAAVAILVSRPGGSGVGGPVGGSVAPSAPVPPASPLPAPSGSPGALVPITGSPAPTASSASILSGFRPVSVTFASPDLGWVLGTSACATQQCPAVILHTSDAGRTWAVVTAPPADVLSGGQPASGADAGVSGIRFADALDGWVYGPDLWATHDGGATWHKVTISGASAAPVVALEAGNGLVHAVVYGNQGVADVASSPVAVDGWAVASTAIPIGAGPVPQTQLVLSGSGGWVLQVDRTVVGGARLVNGAWTRWTPPCSAALGPAILAASSASELIASCDGGLWGPPADPRQAGQHLYVSHDGGSTFTESAVAVPLVTVTAVTSASPDVIALGGGTSSEGVIEASFDGGTTWTTVFRANGMAQVDELGFTTQAQGVAIITAASEDSLLMTRDGGKTWSRVVFGGS
jgi:hypothetical protein